MLRALVYALAALHLGPGIAFALLAFGCDGAAPLLGSLCEGGTFRSFALLTVSAWLLLAVGFAAVQIVRRAQRNRSATSP